MFLENLKNTSTSYTPSFIEEEPQESHALRFLKGLGNSSEFAVYFSGGVLLALICRLIPRLMVFYAFLVIAVVGYLWLFHNDAEPHIKRSVRLTGLAIALSAIGGNWDGIVLLLAGFSLWQLLAFCAIVVGVIWVCIEALRYKAGR